ncbi:MAG: DUF4912 domain-containing protein [Acidobacteria bacterium]|nr:DUF4912 domain-containing protein [Acidobacteriota bacterium]
MPLIFPGSSELTIKQPLPSAVVDKLAELSTDEPLPEAYPGDRIRLLAQSPRKLYLYWGLAQDPYDVLERAFGAQSARYTLVVRLVNTESGESTLHLASPTKSQWLDVPPGGAYRAELGLYAPGRVFIRLLSSNVAQTPRSGVARTVDASSDWNISAENFAQVLDEAGYVSDALEVTLEAVDELTGDGATRAVAGAFSDEELPAMTQEELAEMRGLLAALAFGARSESLQTILSPPLANWLERAGRHGSAVSGERLVELLRTMLGIEMSYLPQHAPAEEAMRRTARVIVGASEVNLPVHPFHLWMPSMNVGLLKSIVSLTH